MFEKKSQEEIDKMTPQEYETYLVAKEAFDAENRKKEIEKAIEEAQKNNVSKEEIEKLTEKQEAIVKELEAFGLRMKSITEPSKREDAPKTFYGAMLKAFESAKDGLEDIVTGKSKNLAIKAVVNITDATTIDAVGSDNHINLTQNTGIISKIRSRILKYLSNVGTGRLVGNRVNWIEELDEQGTPIFIAEAATKTKVSVRYEEREKKSKKIGIYSKVSTEMLRNLPMLIPYIQNNLVKRVDIATEDQLFAGDDTGNNLAGLTEYAVPFTGGSLAGTLPTGTASDADVFRAIALQVEEAFGVASAIFVRPSVLAAMDVEKSADGIYLLPPFRAMNGNMVAGMELIPSNGMPAGVDFIGGDLSVVQVRFADEMSIQIDMSGDDFINNLRTILVEQELVQWVSANDVQLLVQGAMATAKTALEV